MNDPTHIPVFIIMGRRIRENELPFLPFHMRAPTVITTFPDSGMPFRLYPEHRDLPQWTAANDGAPRTRPPHGGYPDA